MGSSASLDRSPRKNWVENSGGLPPYVREVARSIHQKRGVPLDRAIGYAIAVMKRWAAGGGDVTEKTRAKAAKAVAQWEALKAKNATRRVAAAHPAPLALAARRTFSDPKSGTTTVTTADADDPRVAAMAAKLQAKGYGNRERCLKVATAIIRRGKGAKGGRTSSSSSTAAAHGAAGPLALGQGPSCKCGGAHDLVFYANRSTPAVVHPGDDAPQKQGYGNVTRRRKATAAEQRQIASGQWVRVDQSGNRPSDTGYKRTKYRPQLVKAAHPADPRARLVLAVATARRGRAVAPGDAW